MNLPNHGPHAATTINVLNSDTGMLGAPPSQPIDEGVWPTIVMLGIAGLLGYALFSRIRSNNPPRRYRRRRSVR